MNPFQAIMGQFGPSGNSPMPSAPMQPGNGFGGIFGQMQQLASQFQNPQQLVSRFFPDAPAEVSNDPEQLVNWLQQSGRVSPQMVQMARSMMGGR